MIDRRSFVAGLLGTAGAADVARAQSQRPSGKIGFMSTAASRAGVNPVLVVLRPAWQKLGYVEGESVLLRWAEGDLTRMPTLLDELIRLDAGVLIVSGAAATRAARQVTSTVPIVAIDLETDPVRAGLAASVARPGGNVTGLFMDLPSLAGKWIELLREVVPSIERVGIVWDPLVGGADQLETAKLAARSSGIEATVVETRQPDAYDEALRRLGPPGRTGLVELSRPGSIVAIAGLAAAARTHRLPFITFQKINARAGALLSYGPVMEVYYPRAVVLADMILKGAKPADLPIEQPAKFELVINLKTAKALELTIPPSILARADEVIE